MTGGTASCFLIINAQSFVDFNSWQLTEHTSIVITIKGAWVLLYCVQPWVESLLLPFRNKIYNWKTQAEVYFISELCSMFRLKEKVGLSSFLNIALLCHIEMGAEWQTKPSPISLSQRICNSRWNRMDFPQDPEGSARNGPCLQQLTLCSLGFQTPSNQ